MGFGGGLDGKGIYLRGPVGMGVEVSYKDGCKCTFLRGWALCMKASVYFIFFLCSFRSCSRPRRF